MDSVTAIILGGGRGQRLMPLTRDRAKPSVGFAGKYRLIDIPISNCIHSDIKRIYVLTQFLSASLHRHIMQTYQFDHFTEGFVDILAAEQKQSASDWFQGTADAVRATLGHTDYYPANEVLILSGDQLYRMDYRDMLRTHRESKADITVAAAAVPRCEAPALGVLQTASDGSIAAFHEKPGDTPALDALEASPKVLARHGIEADEPRWLVSMGIYVFDPVVLHRFLEGTTHKDFGADVLPDALKSSKMVVHPFSGHWRDIGTISSLYEANLSLCRSAPPFDLYRSDWPIYTRSRSLPPNHIVRSDIRDSLVVEGCKITGATIYDSVVGMRSSIGEGSRLDDVVMLGADFYPDESPTHRVRNAPPVGIGRDCVVERAIIDKNVRIGDGVRIRRREAGVNERHDTHWICDGIVVIPKDTAIPAGADI